MTDDRAWFDDRGLDARVRELDVTDRRCETAEGLRVDLRLSIPDGSKMFATRHEVDPVRHLIGTAAGWGGLPASEARHHVEARPRPAGRFTFTFEDVPVDAFRSLCVDNRRGCFEADPYESFGLNSITATPDRSGIATLLLPSDDHGLQNFAHVMGGWDYELRLHQPHQSVLDTTWTPPTPEPANWNPRNRAP